MAARHACSNRAARAWCCRAGGLHQTALMRWCRSCWSQRALRASTAVTGMASEDRLQLRSATCLGLLLHLGRGLSLAADQGLHHLRTLHAHVLQGTEPHSAEISRKLMQLTCARSQRACLTGMMAQWYFFMHSMLCNMPRDARSDACNNWAGHLHAALKTGGCSITILPCHGLRLVLRQGDLHIQQGAA